MTTTLYVGNINAPVGYIHHLFSKHGKILSFTPKRGFAFVQYGSVEEANAAIGEYGSNYAVAGRTLIVNIAKNRNDINNNNNNYVHVDGAVEVEENNENIQQVQTNNRIPYKENSLHIGNLPYQITDEQLQKEFEEFGILSFNIIRTRKCFAIIELGSDEVVQTAIEKKNGITIEGRQISVTKQFEQSSENFVASGRGRGSYRGYHGGFRGNYSGNYRGNYRGDSRGFRGRGGYSRGRGGYSRGFRGYSQKPLFVNMNNDHHNNSNNINEGSFVIHNINDNAQQ